MEILIRRYDYSSFHSEKDFIDYIVKIDLSCIKLEKVDYNFKSILACLLILLDEYGYVEIN